MVSILHVKISTNYILSILLKQGNHKTNLVIKVQNSQGLQIIDLVGIGVDRKLKISNSFISFPAIIPNTIVQESFTVENPHSFPIEFYWQHLKE